MMTLAMVVGILLAWHRARQMEIDANRLLDFGLIMVTLGVIGSRILHVLAEGYFWDYVHLCTNPLLLDGDLLPSGLKCVSDLECTTLNLGGLCHPEAGTCHPARDCLRVLKVWYGGFALYGGILFCIPFGIWYTLKYKMGVWRVADIAGFVLPLSVGIGRLGCWFGGCCYGGVCDPDVGVTFARGSLAYARQIEAGLINADALTSLPVHPAQLWSSGINLLIFALTYFVIFPRRKAHGETFWWYLILYGCARFSLELMRGDTHDWYLSLSQLIALPVIAIGVWMLARCRRKYPLKEFPLSEPTGRWV